MDELEIDPSLLDEVVAEAEQEANEPPLALQELAERMTKIILASPKAELMILEMENLEVVRKDGLHRRESFIGGEAFSLIGAVASNDGRVLNWVYRPEYACGFESLLLREHDAHRMTGMKVWLDGALADLMVERVGLFKQQQDEAERAKIGSRSEYKKIGFGSW